MIGMGNSSANSQTSDYGSQIYEAQDPYLQDIYSQAQAMNQDQAGMYGPMTEYGGQAVQTAAGMQDYQNDPRMQIYSDQIGQQFNQQIMPALQGDAQLAGALGNSRNQIGQAMAASEAQANLQNFSGQLYGENQNRALQAAGMQPGLVNSWGNTPWQGLQNYTSLIGQPVVTDAGSFGYNNASSFNMSIFGG